MGKERVKERDIVCGKRLREDKFVFRGILGIPSVCGV